MKRVAGVLLSAALLLGGCAAPPLVPSFAPVEPGAVVAARKQAGIADCPSSSSTVAARADGLPDLALSCLGGDSSVRLAGLRGQPMVINVWAQWCGPCREEAPHLRRLAETAGDKILMLGLDFDDPSPERAVEFASVAGWRYPQLADPDRRLGAVIPLGGLPTTLFVDADGVIVHKQVGKLRSYEDLAELVRTKLQVRL